MSYFPIEVLAGTLLQAQNDFGCVPCSNGATKEGHTSYNRLTAELRQADVEGDDIYSGFTRFSPRILTGGVEGSRIRVGLGLNDAIF